VGLTFSWLYLQKHFNGSKNKNEVPLISENDPSFRKFGLKIEKIQVLAPVIKDVDGNKESAYNKALESGVAHYKGTHLPGGGGNIFIFGHSSSNIGTGKYAKIFAHLGELEKGDLIIIIYNDKEFKYTVSEKKVVEESDTSVLKATKKEQLTLMTCWPVGTRDKRLVIKALSEGQ